MTGKQYLIGVVGGTILGGFTNRNYSISQWA